MVPPGRYDQVVLAGASLAGVMDFGEAPEPHWSGHASNQSMSGSRSLSLTTRSSRCWPWSTGPAVPDKLFGLLGENPTYEEETAVHETQARKFSNLISPRPSRRQICTSRKTLDRHSPRLSPEKPNAAIITELYKSAI